MQKTYFFAGISIFFWSTIAAVSKLLLNTLNSYQILMFSSLFAALGLFVVNLWSGKDSLHSAIYVYNTSDFSLTNRINIDDKMMVHHIEFDKNTNSYYVLGFVRGDDGVLQNGFVAKFENQQINNMFLLSEDEFDFFRSYKSLEMHGFTEKKHRWTYIDYELQDLKSMNHTLAKLYAQKKAE